MYLFVYQYIHLLGFATSNLSSLVNQKVVGLFSGGIYTATTVPIFLVVLYGAYLTITGSMSPGDLTSFILYSLTGEFLHGFFKSCTLSGIFS